MPAGAPHRVLVVDDEPDVAAYAARILRRRGGCEVTVVTDALEAVAAARVTRPDVVVTDISMPGISGIDLMGRLRAEQPALRVVVMTAHLSVDYAVSALRSHADEFLTKPMDPTELVAVVERLATRSRAERETGAAVTVLAIGAHPDDVEIGVGATLAAHRAAGDRIVVLTLSHGARGGPEDSRQHESLAAAERLGARLFLEDLPDAVMPADDAVAAIERVVAEVAPAIVYTHTGHERHQDHRTVHAASMVATRRVPFVGCYQSPSTTVDFRPNRFVTVDEHIATKLELLGCFGSQTAIRGYLDPDFVASTARYWSRFGTGTHAEPLEIVRDAASVPVHTRSGAADLPVAADLTPGGDL